MNNNPAKPMSLFSVKMVMESKLHLGYDYKNVPINLFAVERTDMDKRIQRMIVDGVAQPHFLTDEKIRMYYRGTLEELFSEREIEPLKEYFQRHYSPAQFLITEEAAPIPMDLPFLSIPVGGPTEMIVFAKREDWPFDFSVYGYYDVRSST